MADQTKDYSEMSDEELLNADLSSLAFNSSQATEQVATPDEEEVETPDPVVVSDDDDEEEKSDEEVIVTPDDEEEVAEVAETPAPAGKVAPAKEDKTTPADKAAEVVVPEAEAVKAFYDKITAPFKANGRDMKVENADEAIQLMQMGANYNKKMAALKPNLQLMKSLETAGLLSQEKIDFLIDVMAKKPEAISKLVKDSGIDPLDISPEKAGDYRPTSYKVSDKTMALDEVLEELEGSAGFARTVDVVGNKWDKESKGIVADNPAILKVLNAQIESGIFDEITAGVERERVLGRLTGLSDLEAYRQVGDAMASSGKFKHLEGPATPQSQGTAPAKVVVPPKPKQAEDSDRRNKRQAASPTRAAAPTSTKLPADFNPLALSDEEIQKLDLSKFK